MEMLEWYRDNSVSVSATGDSWREKCRIGVFLDIDKAGIHRLLRGHGN